MPGPVDQYGQPLADPNNGMAPPPPVAPNRTPNLGIGGSPASGINGSLSTQFGPNPIAAGWAAGGNPSFGGIGTAAAGQMASNYNEQAGAFGSRAGITADMGASNASYGMAGNDFNASQAARQGQLGALGTLASAANGTAPDIAVQQMNAQAAQAAQAQRSIGAGAGGGFGGAAAREGAARSAQNLVQQNVGAANQQQATDEAQARAAYSQATNDLRSTDQSQRNASIGQAYNQGQLANAQTQLGLGSQASNDAQTGFYNNMGAQATQLGENGALTQFGGTNSINATNAGLNAAAFNTGVGAAGGVLQSGVQAFNQPAAAPSGVPTEDEGTGENTYGV